jgi:hypothetical protein
MKGKENIPSIIGKREESSFSHKNKPFMYLGGLSKLWKSWTTGEVRIQPIVTMMREITLNEMEGCKIRKGVRTTIWRAKKSRMENKRQ